MKKTEQHTDLEQTKPCKTLSQEMVCKGPPSLLTSFSQKKNKLQNWYPRPFPRVPKLQESQENLNESGLMLVLTFGANLLPIKHYQCVKQTRKPPHWKTYSNCKLAYYI